MEHLDSLDEGIDSVRNVFETSDAFDSSVVTDVRIIFLGILGCFVSLLCFSFSLPMLDLQLPLWIAIHRYCQIHFNN